MLPMLVSTPTALRLLLGFRGNADAVPPTDLQRNSGICNSGICRRRKRISHDLAHGVFGGLGSGDDDVGVRFDDLLYVPFGQAARCGDAFDVREYRGHIIAQVGALFALDARDFTLLLELAERIERMVLEHDHARYGNLNGDLVVRLVDERSGRFVRRRNRRSPVCSRTARHASVARKAAEHAGHRHAACSSERWFDKVTVLHPMVFELHGNLSSADSLNRLFLKRNN